MAQRGGRRPGAGRKPGSKSKLTKANKATLTELAMTYSERAIDTLAEVMSDPEQTGAARIAAANSILDRALGKPATIPDDGGDDNPSLNINVSVKPAVGDVRVTRSDS